MAARAAVAIVLFAVATSVQADVALGPRRASAAEVRAAVHAELATGSYRTNPDESALVAMRANLVRRLMRDLGSMLKRVGDLFAKPLQYLGFDSQTAGLLCQWAVGLLALLVLAAVVYAIARNVRIGRERGLSREAAVAALRTASDTDELLALSYRRALRNADQSARDGDYRTAIRYAFWALILWLSENGRFEVDSRRTNREYLARLPSDAPERPVFGDLLGLFEQKWYGLQPATGDEWAHVRAELGRITTGPSGAL